MSERLNYEKCRNKVACLLEKTSILSRKEIVDVLDISFESLAYMKPYQKFQNFLCHTRKFAIREFTKAKEKSITESIIMFKSILKRRKWGIQEFIRFCQINRIPYLYYIPQIKKYVFPNELLLPPILNRRFIIAIKAFINGLKVCESFMFTSTNDIIEFSKKLTKKNTYSDVRVDQYLVAFIRKNYIYGETKEQMYERLEFNKELKESNEEIMKNLYSIANLELIRE